MKWLCTAGLMLQSSFATAQAEEVPFEISPQGLICQTVHCEESVKHDRSSLSSSPKSPEQGLWGSNDPDCGSSETRNLVVQIAKNNAGNKLTNFILQNSQSLRAQMQKVPRVKTHYRSSRDTDEKARPFGLWRKSQPSACTSAVP
jgi:hypothetical protein